MAAVLTGDPGEFALDVDRDAMHTKTGVRNLREPHAHLLEQTDIAPFRAYHSLVIRYPHDAAHSRIGHVPEEGIAAMQNDRT